MESPSCSAISATGTYLPSTCNVDLPNLNSSMSFSRGASRQPESETLSFASSGAAQDTHCTALAALFMRHHEQTIISTAFSPVGRPRKRRVQTYLANRKNKSRFHKFPKYISQPCVENSFQHLPVPCLQAEGLGL